MRVLPCVVVALALASCSRPEPVAEPVRAVRTLTVREASAGGEQSYAAEVRARIESPLAFRVGGKILRRAVDLGSAVKAGQVLASLDPRDLRLGQEAAGAALTAAEVAQRQAEADFRRYRDLQQEGFISAAELERRETALKAAQAQLELARAQSGVQGNQAGYATLVAHAAGVITAVNAEPGMVVAAGTPVVRLAENGPRDAVFAVPEDQVEMIKSAAAEPGRLKARLWGGSDLLPVTVREVAAAADPATRTFTVKADLGDASSSVRLGQTATVVVDLPKAANVRRLPLSALKEEGGRSIVWVVDPATMTVSARPVQVAGAAGNEAVVTQGLATGDRVITAGVHVLSPGQKVKWYVDPGVSAASAVKPTPVTVR